MVDSFDVKKQELIDKVQVFWFIHDLKTPKAFKVHRRNFKSLLQDVYNFYEEFYPEETRNIYGTPDFLQWFIEQALEHKFEDQEEIRRYAIGVHILMDII